MKGYVLYFNDTQGIISGENGKRYKFNISQWKEKINPKKGYQVDFEVKYDEALEIYLLNMPKSITLEETKIFEAKDEVLYKLNKIGKFKLAGIGILLILLSIIIFVLIIKSGIFTDIEYRGGRFITIFHEGYFYIPEIIALIGAVLFSNALKNISYTAYKKWLRIVIAIFISIIGFEFKNPFIGFISVFIIFYSLYKLPEVFKILSIETNIEKLQTIQKIFMGAFISSVITFILIIAKIKLSYFFSLVFVALFGIGWLLSAITFFSNQNQQNLD